MRNLFFAAGFAFLTFATPIAAYMECDSRLSPLAMTDCVFSNLDAATKRMDKVIVRYQPRLSAEQRQLFNLAQQKWKDYMMRACEFEASAVAGGSAYPTVIALCRTRLTHQRRIDLIKLYRCREGDLNCPAPDPDAPAVEEE